MDEKKEVTAPQGGAAKAEKAIKTTITKAEKVVKPKAEAKPKGTASPDKIALENAMLKEQLATAYKALKDFKAGLVKETEVLEQEDKQDAAALEAATPDDGYVAPKSDMKQVKAIMADMKVNELHENSKGEFFTDHHLAVNSEKGKASRVKTHINTISE